METQDHTYNLAEHQQVVVDMLREIDEYQSELESLNENLLAISNNASSEYGDRILEQLQMNLFYLQRILRRSTNTLTKHKIELTEIVNGSVSKGKDELSEYLEYCHETADRVRKRVDKYKSEMERTIKNNKWQS